MSILQKTLFLFLIILIAVNPISAFQDDFQDHPGNLLTDKWVITSGTPTIAQYPSAYTQQMALKGSGKIKLKTPVASNYWAFSAVYIQPGGYCSNWNPQFFNSTGASLGTLVLDNVFICADASYTHKHLFEFIYSSGVITGYLNGIEIGSKALASQPYNIEIYINPSNSYFDDFTSETGIIGMNNRYTETDQSIQVSYSEYVPWASPESTYTVDVIKLYTGQTMNSTSVSHYSGYVVWDRQSTLAYNYDAYRVRLLKDGSQEAFHDFFYVPSAIYGTINFTSDNYMQGDPMNFTYELFTPAFLTYNYRAILITSSGTTVGTVSLDDLTGVGSFISDGLAVGTYYGLLQRKCVSGCTDWELINYDITAITEGFNINGYTYDASTGNVLPSVNVNISQADGTWFNTTSNSITGYYNLSGFLTIRTTFNASKVNYSMEDFSVTPTFPKTKTINLYLWPTNITHANTTIQGLTLANHYMQSVPSATVNVYNVTNLTTVTSNSWGYYQVETTNSTYSVNATKSGYRASSVYSVTPITNEWKVQNLILYPQYTIVIYAKDSVTSAYISSFSALVNGVLYQTTNGTIIVPLEYGSYLVSVAATGYSGTSGTINVEGSTTQTFLLTPTTSTSTTQIQGSTMIQTIPHDVSFVVQDLMFNKKPGISVTAQGYNTTTGSFSILSALLGINFNTTPINTAVMTGTTGTDGAVDFKMDGSIYYIVTFSGSGVNATWRGYPTQYQYLIIVPTSLSTSTYTGGVDQLSAINITLSTSIINATTAKIFVNYTDTLSQTSNLKFYLNQSIMGDPNNQTNIQTINGGTNATFNATFTVSNYSNKEYIVSVTATHQTFGLMSYSYAVKFPPVTPLTGFNPISILMMIVGLILFIAGFWGQTSTEQGAGIICGFMWLLSGIGIFSNVNLGLNFYLGLTLATIIAILMNVNARSRKEGIS